MKLRSMQTFVTTAFLTICAVSGCAGADSSTVGADAETAIDADVSGGVTSDAPSGVMSATVAATEDMVEPEGEEADMETWKTAIDGLSDDFIFGLHPYSRLERSL